MLSEETKNAFLELVRLGVGTKALNQVCLPISLDWNGLRALATKQGLLAIVLDGLEQLPVNQKPSKSVLLQWIGEVLQDENIFAAQYKTAVEMASVFHHNDISTYVLKGMVIAECYPTPSHRRSSDMDCFLLPSDSCADNVWEKGNGLMEQQGYIVDRSYYKNSTFYLPNLAVENHQYMTPFRGNPRMKRFELLLQAMIKEDDGENCFEGTHLNRPPVMMSALFLIEHAYTHFLHEGLTWRHILDWMMYSRKYKDGIDWLLFNKRIDEFGFRRFYDSYIRLGEYLLGEKEENELGEADKLMLADVWAPLDLHETHLGIKGKLALAGNTWRARWKYRYFSEISMLHMLWIQATGVLFMKHPTLD